MNRPILVLFAVLGLSGVVSYLVPVSGHTEGNAAPIFGVTIPSGYRDWKLIAVAQRRSAKDGYRAIEALLQSCAFRPADPLTRWGMHTPSNRYRVDKGRRCTCLQVGADEWRRRTPVKPAPVLVL